MSYTIKSSDEFSFIFGSGKRYHTPYFSILVLEKQHDHQGRVAFIAGKKLGNAVWRNRAKRRMRAVCRELNGPFPGYDVIFLAKRNVASGDYYDMTCKARKKLEEANIL